MKKIHLELIVLYLIFLIVAIFVPSSGKSDFINLILTIASFLFAILIGFSTVNRRSRLELIRTKLRNNDAMLISIYTASKEFSKKITDKCQKLIDDILMTQIDYKITDYEKSSPQVLRLYEFVLELETKNKKEEMLKEHMIYDIKDLLKNHKEATYAVNDKMMLYEWVIPILLCTIMIICLMYIKVDGIFAIIVIPILCVTLILLPLILRDLNNLKWQEDEWIWLPLINLFIELDLKPYIVEDVIKSGRLNFADLIEKTTEYRLVRYPNKYPNFTNKEILLINTREQYS